MTLHAYQTLYESSIAFGIRKALQAEQGKTDMEGAIARLEEDKDTLEKGREQHSVAKFQISNTRIME